MNALKIVSKWISLAAFIVGVAFAPVLILEYVIKIPTRSSPTIQATTIHKQRVNAELPVHLIIPKIGVDAALDYVGLTPQGELGVPTDPANVAWYDHGPRPGEEGNAVIDGHFGYRDHIPAVFDNLHALQRGDRLYVEDKKDKTITFIVRELRTYSPGEYAPAVFRSGDGRAHLNLITCQGNWNQTQKSYPNRLVVFADKVI